MPDITPSGGFRGEPIPIANVTRGVGPGRSNFPGDVQLVQFILRRLQDTGLVLFDDQSRQIADIKIDGIFGNQTLQSIGGFQRFRSRGSSNSVDPNISTPVSLDGGVDPANVMGTSQKTFTIYTIFLMNREFTFRNGASLPDSLDDIPDTIQPMKSLLQASSGAQ